MTLSFVNLCMAYILFSSTVKRFVIRQCWSGPNNYKWGNFLCQGPSEGFFQPSSSFKFFFHKKGSNSDICQPRGPEIETGWRFPVKACHAALSSTLFIRKETPNKKDFTTIVFNRKLKRWIRWVEIKKTQVGRMLLTQATFENVFINLDFYA